MPENMVNGFNINGTPVPYNYDSLGNKLEKTSIAREYSNIDTYDIGEYVIYNGRMYRCKQKISVGESFDSTKWTECSIGPELNYIKKFIGFSENAKYALLNLLNHVAYVDEHGQDYYDEFEVELFRTADLVSISAVFNQGQDVIYDTDSLDTLRQYLVVTATYDDSSTGTVTKYTLSGTLTEGTSTITVSYRGKTTTFDVTVSTHLLYSLENYAFDTENINTQIALWETDQDWTIAFDANLTTNPALGGGNSWRLVATWVSSFNDWAINLGKDNGTATNLTFAYMGSAYVTVSDITVGTGRYRFVITHAKNSGSATLKIRKDSGAAQTFSQSSAFQPNTSTVSFGASNTSYKLPKGTINKAYIYDTVLTTKQINAFLGL